MRPWKIGILCARWWETARSVKRRRQSGSVPTPDRISALRRRSGRTSRPRTSSRSGPTRSLRSVRAIASSWNPQTFTFDYRRYITDGDPRLFASPHLPRRRRDHGGRVSTIADNGGGGRLFFDVFDCNSVGHCDAALDTWTIPWPEKVVSAFSTLRFPCTRSTTPVARSWSGSTSKITATCSSSPASPSAISSRCLPAPASARFGDVPVSDPGFQYIEALVASGISAGCGGGNYCPNNALTRAARWRSFSPRRSV